MIVHKSIKPLSRDCVCGAMPPMYTTTDDKLVTCKFCRNKECQNCGQSIVNCVCNQEDL